MKQEEKSLARKLENQIQKENVKKLAQIEKATLRSQVDRIRNEIQIEIDGKKLQNIKRKAVIAKNTKLTSQSLALAKKINNIELKKEKSWILSMAEAQRETDSQTKRMRNNENSIMFSILSKQSYIENKRNELRRSKNQSICEELDSDRRHRNRISLLESMENQVSLNLLKQKVSFS